MSGRRIWAPRPGMTRAPSDDVNEQADTLVRLLREHGPQHAHALRVLAESRYWGPGCFGAALGRARSQGRVRRVGFRTYAAADSGNAGAASDA
jgi:hypothetical protein